MKAKLALTILFASIFVLLGSWNVWALLQQPLWEWGGLAREPDRWWTIATFLDAYFGFITFYVWVLYKEARLGPRLGWFVAIMSLGNLAMSAYVLLQLRRVAADAPAWTALTSRNA